MSGSEEIKKMMDDSLGLKLFTVYFSHRDKSYRNNRSVGVVANDLLEAAELVRLKAPDTKIWDVAHNGCVDFINVDPY